MNLTRHTDYGLRVLMVLAKRPKEHSKSISTAEIANAFQISLTHLQKVVQALSQNGFIHTSRGRGGGITLARGAEDIILGDVVRALEPDLNVVECFSDSRCALLPNCGLKPVLGRAVNAFLVELDKTTLSDVV